jgi:hypothetical protein
MDLTILSANLLLSEDWMFIHLDENNAVKVTCLTKPAKVNDISIRGRYEIGQFDADGNGYNLRQIRWEDFSIFHKLPLPEFFDYQYLGIHLAPDFEPFAVKIEGLIMSVTNSGNTPKKVITTPTAPALVADTSKKILSANDKRVGVSVLNKTNGTVALEAMDTINFATKAYFVIIPAGELYESGLMFTGDVWAKGDVGVTGSLDVRESATA